MIDMSRIIGFKTPKDIKTHFDKNDVFAFGLENTMDFKLFVPKLNSFLEKNNLPPEKIENVLLSDSVKIKSTNRTVGTILGSEIQKKFSDTLSEDAFSVNFIGGAGLSFGSFIPKGQIGRASCRERV